MELKNIVIKPTRTQSLRKTDDKNNTIKSVKVVFEVQQADFKGKFTIEVDADHKYYKELSTIDLRENNFVLYMVPASETQNLLMFFREASLEVTKEERLHA